MLRILTRSCATAIVLALIGLMLAEFAGLYVESQTKRTGLDNGGEVRSSVAGTLPFTMATGGFIVVFVGESLMALWKKR